MNVQQPTDPRDIALLPTMEGVYVEGEINFPSGFKVGMPPADHFWTVEKGVLKAVKKGEDPLGKFLKQFRP